MWISDLADYYKRGKPSEIQVKMLVKVYGSKDAEVLQAAAVDYMTENNFFPSVADFQPYVQTAEHMQMAKAPRTFGIPPGPAGDDERFAITLLDHEMIAFMLSPSSGQGEVTFEFFGRWMLLYRDQLPLEQLPALLAWGQSTRSVLPTVLREWYPAR